ncbi:hypothetical protein V5799_011911 [Amblyomma americanum]|uniref:Uncharacterized protein n=1 Tax=Amblyomma americanum TaxID=6943 RepID=A0AAQ4EFH2_AMBAM
MWEASEYQNQLAFVCLTIIAGKLAVNTDFCCHFKSKPVVQLLMSRIVLMRAISLSLQNLQVLEGHSRRMCRIMSPERWRQYQFLTDCLWVACSQDKHQVLCFPKRKPPSSKGQLLVLGNQRVPESFWKGLKLGGKFFVQPKLQKDKKLSLRRSISCHVRQEEQPWFLVECVKAVKVTEGQGRREKIDNPAKILVLRPLER